MNKELVYKHWTDNLSKIEQIVDEMTPEQRGVYLTEGSLLCTVFEMLGVDLIIESGTAYGTSAEFFAKYFDCDIITIDHDKFYGQYGATRDKLSKYKNLSFVKGDSFTKIPELLKANSDKKIGIFIDGPKDSQQMDLRKVINRNNQEGNIVCIGYHDIGPITFGRIKDRKIYQSSIFDNNNLIHSHDLDFMSEEFLYLANKNKKLLGNMKLSLKDGFWPKGPGVMIEKI